ncbi:MAG: bifunctional DNA-formamidopyrimidine glycosylase/DNA-(apurinic or apyrimidinic site) lyase [Proteobacteria bacterium]|nr:bifunctional DNA-formamidopyrimidine glycosylase/DNA-(apurinic or apyrimidinic site) lyase [Pseudomonadota bacterium]
MPELPEVETIRRGLLPALQGQTITHVIVRRPNLRIPFPEKFAERLTARRIVEVARRAKYLTIILDDGTVLVIHLGMSGRISVLTEEKEPGPHDHVDIRLSSGAVVRYCDPRRFGLMTLTDEENLPVHKMFRDLGPDPTGNEFNAAVLADRLRDRASPIKAALLDQSVVAGLGNIYVCESLYRSGISPRRLAKNVKGSRVERLTAEIRNVLDDAIAAGGSTLRDYQLPDGELGYFQHQFGVYGREGEACPDCDCNISETAEGGIRRIVQSGRSTFYCTRRQR